MIVRYLFVCVFMISFFGAFAQKKSLQECVNIAWENNISVKQTELSKQISSVDMMEARSRRYPNLNAGSSFNISGRTVDPTNNQFAASSFYTNNYNLSSNVILYRGGQIKNSIKRAQLNEQALDLQVADIKQNIALQVANAYLNVLFSEENLVVAEKRLQATKEQVVLLEKLIAGGLRPSNAIYDLNATQAANEQAYIEADGNKAFARLQLNQIMRISADETFELVIPEVLLAQLEDPFSMTTKSIYENAVDNQPTIQNTKLQLEIADTDKKVANAGLYPTLSLGGSLGTNYSSLAKEQIGSSEIIVNQDLILNGNQATIGFPQTIPILENQSFGSQLSDNVTYGYGVSLSVPIYNNYVTKANISRAEIAMDNAALNHLQNQDQFRIQVEQSLLDARNAKKQYDAAEKSSEASKKALENAEKSYAAGLANIYELNIATNNYDAAVLQSLIAKYDYIFKMKVIDFYQGKSLNF